MVAVAIPGGIGDLSQSTITIWEWHLWHILRRSNGSRTRLDDVCGVLGCRRGGKNGFYGRHGPVKRAQFMLTQFTIAMLLSRCVTMPFRLSRCRAVMELFRLRRHSRLRGAAPRRGPFRRATGGRVPSLSGFLWHSESFRQ